MYQADLFMFNPVLLLTSFAAITLTTAWTDSFSFVDLEADDAEPHAHCLHALTTYYGLGMAYEKTK